MGREEYATHALFVLIRRRRRSNHRYPNQTRRHSTSAEPASKQDRTRDPHHADHQPMIVRVRTARPLSLQDCHLYLERSSSSFLFFCKCSFASTETIRTVRDGEPRTSTSTSTYLLLCFAMRLYVHRDRKDGEPRTSTSTST